MAKLKKAVISDFSDAVRLVNFRLGKNGELIRREGTRLAGSAGEPIRSVQNVHTVTYFVAGYCLYSFKSGTVSYIGELFGAYFNSPEERVCMFALGDVIHIIGGGTYYCYDFYKDILWENFGHSPLVHSEVVDDGTTAPVEYESINLISSRVRTRIIPDFNIFYYVLYGVATEIISVTADGVLLASSEYELNSYPETNESYIYFKKKLTLQAKEFIVEYATATVPANVNRNTFFRGTKSYIHEVDGEARLFVYGGSLGAAVRYSEAADIDGKQESTLDYFPPHTVFTVGDGTKSVTHITRYADRTLVATESCIYQVNYTSDSTENGLRTKVFSTKLVLADLGIRAGTEAVSHGEKLYLINDRGLFSLYHDRVTDSFRYERIEFPSYAAPSYSQLMDMKLHIDRQRGELWCVSGGNAFIYDLINGHFYRFTVPSSDGYFTHSGDTAFYAGDSIYLFDSSRSGDYNGGFEAMFQSSPLTLGDIFREKDIDSFGAAISNRFASRMSFSLLGDNGATASLTLYPDTDGMPSPYVGKLHARLGNVHHVTLTAVCPSDSDACDLHSVMFTFIEKGEEG